MAKAQDQTAPEAATTVALSFKQLKELLAEARGSTMDPAAIAAVAAKAAAEAAAAGVQQWKPHEIRRPEQRSAYNPEGERDHPKPRLKFHVYEGSYPLGDPSDNRTLTKAEIEALNSLTPGFFRVEMFDGTDAIVEIRAQMNARQEIERLWVLLPEGKDKNGYGSWVRIAGYCTEARRVGNPQLAAKGHAA